MPFRSISIRAKLALSAAALTAFAIVAVIALTTSLMTRDSARESEAHASALMTGYAAEVATNSSFLGPDMALIVKPFDSDALVAKVDDVMRGPAPAAAASHAEPSSDGIAATAPALLP